MSEINIGDKVRFLNDIGGGKVTGFRKGGIVLVEDEDGFEVPVMQSEVVVVEPVDSPTPQATASAAPVTAPQPKPHKEERKADPEDEETDLMSLPKEELVQRIMKLEMKVRHLQMKLQRLEDAKALREKIKHDDLERRELNRQQKDGILEIDLHADEILESTAGMSAKDIKEYQLSVFHKTMKEHGKEKGKKIVFIHGNGEGVLRKAIIDELRRSYKKCEYQDASFQQYGFGATMVIVH